MDDAVFVYSRRRFNGRQEVQKGHREVLGGRFPAPDSSTPEFHLAYTRYCAQFDSFRGSGWNEDDGWDALGPTTPVGAQYRDLGKPDKVYKNHAASSGLLETLSSSQARSTTVSVWRRPPFVGQMQRYRSTPRDRVRFMPMHGAVQ
ncbi:unnamed protein product [Pylaiella littoralis]